MNFTALTEQDIEVLQQAVAASDRLYIQDIQEVGAAVLTTSGNLFSAIHFEIAADFATVCGEVAAIGCMVAAGQRDLAVIAAVWRDPQGRHFLLPPCGRCREIIADFNPQAWVIVSTHEDHWHPVAINQPSKVRIADLLPLKSHLLGS